MLLKTKSFKVKDGDAVKIIKGFLNEHNGNKNHAAKKVIVVKKTIVSIFAL